MYYDDPSLPPPIDYVEKPSDDDFVCPPLPPPPSDEDLLEVASTGTRSSSASEVSTSTSTKSAILSPTFKAPTKFSVWTPSQGGKVNGSEVNETEKSAYSVSGPTGFRSVSRPISKKPERSSEPTSSTVRTSYTLPDGQQLPAPSDNVKVTPNNELPEGAVYETQTIEGNLVHTDTYYPAPGGGAKVLERTKKTTIIQAEHHHGMGPTDDHGVPVALRSTVENQKAWYKNMFRQIHKFEGEEGDKPGNRTTEDFVETEPEPVVSQRPYYKPKKLGRITDYTPSEPYVVENKPVHKDRIPSASTSFSPTYKHEVVKAEAPRKTEEPVHGTDYSAKLDFTMADYVVTEPKQPTVHPVQHKHAPKAPEVRIPAKAKFEFRAQSDKQLTILKDQTVIITREVNKDWYEGESADGKRSGIFPVAYVELLTKSPAKPARRGRAKAKFDFTANSPKQLSMKKGDAVELVEKVDKNWYKAALGGKAGIVPSNYIEVLQEPEESKKNAAKLPAQTNNAANASKTTNVNHKQTASSSSSNSEPDDKEKMGRASFLAHAVVNSGAHLTHAKPQRGEFDIPELDDAAMGISPRSDTRHSPQTSNDVSSVHNDFEKRLHVSPVKAASKPPPQEYAVKTEEQNNGGDHFDDGMPQMHKHVALYAYVPQNEDELELLGGDIVQVVEKCDDGWFVGSCERTGAFGTFPGNYVIAVD